MPRKTQRGGRRKLQPKPRPSRGSAKRTPKRGRVKTTSPKRGRTRGSERVRVRSVERAIKALGKKRVKPGAIKVSSSRYVGLSKRGVRSKSVTRVLTAITKRPSKAIYSYTVTVKFRRRDGKRDKVMLSGIGVPTLKSAAQRRRRSKTTGRLETAKQARRRMVMRDIEATVHNVVRDEWRAKHDSPPGLERGATRMARKQARTRLRAIKRREQASFQVEFFREGEE